MTSATPAAAYVFQPAPISALPVVGSELRYPVHRIYCVGRNYAEHAIEMGHDPRREHPFFFQKNPDNVLPPGADFPYPTHSSDVHFEMEMVVALEKAARTCRRRPRWSWSSAMAQVST